MLYIPVDKNANIPMIRQVYEYIRMHILSGDLAPGLRLPASRQLAASLAVSRNVITEAYEQLTAEGYLESRPGSGTYVAAGLDLPGLAGYRSSLPLETDAVIKKREDLVDFRTGVPALELIPRKRIGQLYQQVCGQTPEAALDYGLPEGCWELREALAAYLLRSRGVYCRPEQILITTGAAQALYLITRALVSPGDEVVIEDPAHIHFQETLRSCGAALCPVPVDDCGLITERIPVQAAPRFIFVTPSHQFPLGGTLTIQRRLELIQLARTRDCYLVEDDYESEYRFAGTAVSSLQGLDPGRVIYIGTFSKILSPAFRIGYLVLPVQLVEQVRRLKYLVDNHSPVPDQLVLASFMAQGHLERHVARMKKVYRQRQAALINGLTEHLSGRCQVSGNSTGLHIIGEFAGIAFNREMLSRLEAGGVRVYPVEQHAMEKGRHADKIILGYGNLSVEEITEGVRRIAAVLN